MEKQRGALVRQARASEAPDSLFAGLIALMTIVALLVEWKISPG
ncbi:MAG TPA: hypothetical protein VGQ40_04700 [Chthoniobacterales bacterium]|nr:hypothetical protein [Chthoniobacterales bacterium]